MSEDSILDLTKIISISCFNEEELPLWTKRRKHDSDFDVSEYKLSSITRGKDNHVYIGTDPISQLMLIAQIIPVMSSFPRVNITVAKACVVRSVAFDDRNVEIWQLMLCLAKYGTQTQYCVPEREDSVAWYLFIDNFIFTSEESGARIIKRHDGYGAYVTGIMTLGIHIMPKGKLGRRNWWYLYGQTEPITAGIVELNAENNAKYEKQLTANSLFYFGIFLYDNARLVMRDYRQLTYRQKTHYVSRKAQDMKLTLKDLRVQTSIVKDITDNSHPVFFLQHIPCNEFAKVWDISVLKARSVCLAIPSKEEIKCIDYLDWNEAHQYIRYYQSRRDWKRNIVIAPNGEPRIPYENWPKPDYEPIPLWTETD